MAKIFSLVAGVTPSAQRNRALTVHPEPKVTVVVSPGRISIPSSSCMLNEFFWGGGNGIRRDNECLPGGTCGNTNRPFASVFCTKDSKNRQ